MKERVSNTHLTLVCHIDLLKNSWYLMWFYCMLCDVQHMDGFYVFYLTLLSLTEICSGEGIQALK